MDKIQYLEYMVAGLLVISSLALMFAIRACKQLDSLKYKLKVTKAELEVFETNVDNYEHITDQCCERISVLENKIK